MVTRNSPYVASLEHDLAPPFMMREAGLIVNEKAKINAQDDVSIEDHSIYDPETGLRILLLLDGIFSYFPTRALTDNDIDCMAEYDVIYLTLNSSKWNPYT